MRKALSGKKKKCWIILEGACLQTVSDFFLWLKYNYSPPEEYHGCEHFGRMALHSTPWCSSLALGLIWRCHVRCWGWGSCRRQKHWAKGASRRGEGTLILNSWSWWLGPEITRWQVNLSFCVKDVSLVWGRLFLLSCRQWRPTTVLLPGKRPKRGGLVGCSPWGC